MDIVVGLGLPESLRSGRQRREHTDDGAHQREASKERHHGEPAGHAKLYRDEVIPAMNALRESCDVLETLVDDDLWPLPTYQEMLYIL